MMTGAARCPSEEILENRRALRSSVTLGESSLPSQVISWSPLRNRQRFATYDLGLRVQLQLKTESDAQYWEVSNTDSSVASLASGGYCCVLGCECCGKHRCLIFNDEAEQLLRQARLESQPYILDHHSLASKTDL